MPAFTAAMRRSCSLKSVTIQPCLILGALALLVWDSYKHRRQHDWATGHAQDMAPSDAYVTLLEPDSTVSLSDSFHERFQQRFQKFKRCNTAKSAASFQIKCIEDELCYLGCPKCGSTSMKRQFLAKRVDVINCTFVPEVAKIPLIIITRSPISHFMSAYGQITFQGLKRSSKIKEAERNKYGRLNPVKPSVREKRLAYFVEAMLDRDRRDLIPDVYHAFQMMHFFKGLKRCVDLGIENMPAVYFLTLETINDDIASMCEHGVLHSNLSLCTDGLQHAVKHSASQVNMDTASLKERAQFFASRTPVSDEMEWILRNKLIHDDFECLGFSS